MVGTTFWSTLSLSVLVIVTNASASHRTSTRDEDTRTPIVIRLYLQTELDPRVVAGARMLVTAVLRHAGAEPTWTIWPEVQRQILPAGPIERTDLIVRIVAVGPNMKATTCGTAIGRLVTIFSSCVNVTAARFEVDPAAIDPATVYGYAIVHEVGHVLLPPGHSITGVMRAQPDWIRAAQHTLDFTPDEIRRIRLALVTRFSSFRLSTENPPR
jgi:hypothetical protein